MTVDHDGKIRMDCSSPYAMAKLVGLRDQYRLAFGNDPDSDRHGIVTPAQGLMNPNHYLGVAIHYLRFGPKEVEAELWFNVLAQFVAWDKPNGFPVALTSIYDVAGAQLVASVHATLEPTLATLDVCAEILPLFVQYAFNGWPFRKIYIRYASGAPELDLWQAVFQSDGRSVWERVGVQVDQLNVAGAYSDVETYVLTRERWEAAASEIWDHCGSRPVPAD